MAAFLGGKPVTLIARGRRVNATIAGGGRTSRRVSAAYSPVPIAGDGRDRGNRFTDDEPPASAAARPARALVFRRWRGSRRRAAMPRRHAMRVMLTRKRDRA
jgi:hypothetical protein